MNPRMLFWVKVVMTCVCVWLILDKSSWVIFCWHLIKAYSWIYTSNVLLRSFNFLDKSCWKAVFEQNCQQCWGKENFRQYLYTEKSLCLTGRAKRTVKSSVLKLANVPLNRSSQSFQNLQSWHFLISVCSSHCTPTLHEWDSAPFSIKCRMESNVFWRTRAVPLTTQRSQQRYCTYRRDTHREVSIVLVWTEVPRHRTQRTLLMQITFGPN